MEVVYMLLNSVPGKCQSPASLQKINLGKLDHKLLRKGHFTYNIIVPLFFL